MKATLSHISRNGFHALQSHSYSLLFNRQVSTETLHSSLHRKLTSRPPNKIYDYLSPTPSHLLNVSLADFLPGSCYPPGFSAEELELPHLPGDNGASLSNAALPQGHHLIYFSPQVPGSMLLPDGTDPLQSPGEPFVRRMWAGGTLLFNNNLSYQLELNNRRAYCREHIPNISIKGSEGDERVFVNIERQIGYCGTTTENERLLLDGDIPNSPARNMPSMEAQVDFSPAIIETRNIVFMREKAIATIKEDVARRGKTVKPPHAADFSVSLIPSQSLLFRFSALTFNAHAIHLDPQYCREVEGHRNLLVHGPLTLVLMLSVLRSQLESGEKVKGFDYRNLAPLYADEELKICVRQDGAKDNKYDVWIEGKEGGYAVKGTAVIEQAQRKGP